MPDVSDVVRACFTAWEKQDRAAIEALLADDFTFTSPNDDHISRAEYFQKCWPQSGQIKTFRVLNLFEHGGEAFIRYECELQDGKRFRNTEYFRVDGDKIKEVDVYFGRNV
jgi:ketosteroid isomerase-like protein